MSEKTLPAGSTASPEDFAEIYHSYRQISFEENNISRESDVLVEHRDQWDAAFT